MTLLGSNIIKGGALLDDSRRLVEAWDRDVDAAANLQRIREQNALGKPSRSRLNEVLEWSLVPRLVDAGPHVIPALQGLLDRPAAFREACYYEATRAEPLLAAFGEEALWGWYEDGRSAVRTEDVQLWLQGLTAAGRLRSWGDRVTRRAAHGLLSAARDFGVLEGKALKRFATPRMTAPGFAYVAFREHEQGRSSRGILESTIWRRWLLDRDHVSDLTVQAERLGVLRFARVGSAIRIDWRAATLEEVTHADG